MTNVREGKQELPPGEVIGERVQFFCNVKGKIR